MDGEHNREAGQNRPQNVKGQPHQEGWSSWVIPVALILGLAVLLIFNTGAETPGRAPDSPFEAMLKEVVGYLAIGTEIAAVTVISLAVLRGIFHYIRNTLNPNGHPINTVETVRLTMGRKLVLGLEFTLASDILRTTVAPTRQEIVNLAAIVLLRTLLNYFLEREIRLGEEYKATHPDQ
jgi:uncharacterized membrane protein